MMAMMETAIDVVVVVMVNVQSMLQYRSSAIAAIRAHTKIAAADAKEDASKWRSDEVVVDELSSCVFPPGDALAEQYYCLSSN